MAHAKAEPVGGPLFTKGFKIGILILVVWAITLVYRYMVGIGAVSPGYAAHQSIPSRSLVGLPEGYW